MMCAVADRVSSEGADSSLRRFETSFHGVATAENSVLHITGTVENTL